MTIPTESVLVKFQLSSLCLAHRCAEVPNEDVAPAASGRYGAGNPWGLRHPAVSQCGRILHHSVVFSNWTLRETTQSGHALDLLSASWVSTVVISVRTQ